MPAYNRQLEDEDGNIIYPQITGDNIPNSAVTASKIDFSTMPGNYSLTEVDTGYTWVDGKHIYKKTVDCGALPNATTKNVIHNISGLYRVIKIEGYAYNGSVIEPLPMCTTVSSYNVEVNVGTNYVVLVTDANRSNYTESYVTLYYTKSS